jgi:2-oxoisovalerate dehydrogenase E1 component
MAVSRAKIVDDKFIARVREFPRSDVSVDPAAPIRAHSKLTVRDALELFDAQIASRHIDLAARELRSRDVGYYTIGSAGHEGNAAVAAALRPTDPAFLHYRSGGFFLARAAQVADYGDARYDILLGVCAAADDPISGGRHKVFGSARLNIPPQTSTIASHLPKAVGAAVSIDRMHRLGLDPGVPEDAVVVASFGDASLNHSSAAGAIANACRTGYRNVPIPVLFVCEDNGIGISVTTPPGWVRASLSARAGLQLFSADGLDLASAYDAAVNAVDYVRRFRRPAALHLEVTRLLGHAGSDVEQAYRSEREIEETEDRDPLVRTAKLLVEAGALTPDDVIGRYETMRAEVAELASRAAMRPQLQSAAEVIAPLAPSSPVEVKEEARRCAPAEMRVKFWGADGLPEDDERPRHLAVNLNRALGDLLVKYPELLIFGEDVAVKGGVYHVTAGLKDKAGVARVFDTALDEQAVLGVALGAGGLGALPIAEIQYLAYYHNAEDQVRGEAASQSFFSNGQFRSPMVVRIASFAYQKGFGGHFHNDNAVAALRDVPGIVIASPSRGDDAVRMLRTCAAAAKVDGRVVLFLEPIALYMTRDLYESGDGLWACPYPAPGSEADTHVPIGKGRVWRRGSDLTIVSFANGVPMSLRAAEQLERRHGVRATVLDLRWLQPLPTEDLLREASATGNVLIADETRRSGGVSEAVMAELLDNDFDGTIRRVTSHDTFIPLGPAADHVLLSEQMIFDAGLEIARRRRAADSGRSGGHV